MSESLWYYEKAKECGRRGDAATDPADRARYFQDQSNWHQIARRIDAEEVEVAAKKRVKR
jgi:hypothetical protein